ncbi:MAG TPA: 2Fe-2S iron-sulfur cluster-binding protein [Ramlibacter sp.]|nr:2Fe-2S iron-sulfur cluster-binding protein [Ramlibacter sp.]
MPTLHITLPDGQPCELKAPAGVSIMRAAVDANTEGIIGECGGAAMCGTCHVLVDEAWLQRLPPMELNEDDMLDCTAEPRRPNSRLGCQVRLTDELDGLALTLPPRQR